MNITLILVVLGLIAIISLIVVSLVAKRQREALFRYQRGLQLKRTAEHFEDLAMALVSISDSPRVPALLQRIALETLERVLKDAPEMPQIESSVDKARRHLEAIEKGEAGVPMVCLTSSELAKAQKQIAESLRVLRAESRNGDISGKEMDELTEELQWSWLQLEVRSHQKLGALAEERNDRFGAFSHYKQAQQKLLQSNLREATRLQQIRDLAIILSSSGEDSTTPEGERQSA